MLYLKHTKKLNSFPKMKAFPYQYEAVNTIRDLPFSAIFHEQGLGKTKIAIDLLLYWIENNHVDTVLIVAKKSLVENWKNELSDHTHLKPGLITNDRNNNYYVFNGPDRLMLTHFETLVSERDRFKLFLNSRSVAIIIDESAKIKNPDSIITKTFFELSELFVKRVIMTGTPVANRPYDIWAQIYFLDKGKSLGTSFKEFKKNTDLSNELFCNDKLKDEFEKSIMSIFDKIKSFSVRETKDSGVISLPAKEFVRIDAYWEKYQLALYKTIQKKMRAYIVKDEVATFDDSQEILKRLLRLIQVTSNPKLIDDSYEQVPGKFIQLEKLIYEITNRGEKCIVWTSFIDNVEWLAMEFREFGTLKIHGKMSINDRNRSVRFFKNNDAKKILFATPASAKEGLTLTVANHVIFYDRGFSLDDYLQAQDRIHRISQNKTCYVYNIIMRNSIDEWIEILLNSKRAAAQFTQGDISFEKFKSDIDYSFADIIDKILNNSFEGDV
jgi:SNF2 family DNA or RNA helicase